MNTPVNMDVHTNDCFRENMSFAVMYNSNPERKFKVVGTINGEIIQTNIKYGNNVSLGNFINETDGVRYFSNGTDCYGAPRTSKMPFACGEKDFELLSISEPASCKYLLPVASRCYCETNVRWPELTLNFWNFAMVIAVCGCVLISCYWLLKRRNKQKLRWRTLDRYDLEYTNSILSYEKCKKENKWIKPIELKEYFEHDLLVGVQVGSGMFSQVHVMKMKDRKTFKRLNIAGKIVNQVKEVDFFREVTLLLKASKNCENIVNLIGFVRKPKVILMEYYKYGSLAAALEQDFVWYGDGAKADFPFLCRLQFISQLCIAVEDLHKIGIVHRDIASRNLLLSDDRSRVLLSDFGLARTVDMIRPDKNITQTITIARTSPPESWAKGSVQGVSFGLKTDVWSLAMTMFEIINKRPIREDLTGMKRVKGTLAVIPRKLLRNGITTGESFKRDDELWQIMRQCWRRNPTDRPQVWEVCAIIQRLLDFPLGRKMSVYIKSVGDNSGKFEERLAVAPSPKDLACRVLSWSSGLIDFTDSDEGILSSPRYELLNEKNGGDDFQHGEYQCGEISDESIAE